MSVPNTDDFSLQDVVDEINPTTNSLKGCFDDAVSNGFDPAYEGSKNRLLNFRNYDNKWVLSNAVFNQSSQAFGESIAGLSLRSNGLKVYIGFTTGSDVNKGLQYSISPAWDINPLTSDSIEHDFTTDQTLLSQFFWRLNGDNLYAIDSMDLRVYGYSASTSWNISTLTLDNSFDLSSETSLPQNVFFRDNGSRMFVTDFNENEIFQYTLSTAWDVSSASYDFVSFGLLQLNSGPAGIFFRPDGKKMFIVDATQNDLYAYNLSTAWDLSTASYNNDTFDTSPQTGNAQGIYINPDGDKMFISDNSNNRVYEYDL